MKKKDIVFLPTRERFPLVSDFRTKLIFIPLFYGGFRLNPGLDKKEPHYVWLFLRDWNVLNLSISRILKVCKFKSKIYIVFFRNNDIILAGFKIVMLVVKVSYLWKQVM